MLRFRRRTGRFEIDPRFEGPIPPFLRSRKKKRPDLDEGGVPVEPDKPKNLSGGAAAALEFDED